MTPSIAGLTKIAVEMKAETAGMTAAGVAHGQRPRDIIEIVGRDRLADLDDQLVVEEGLAIPELVEFLADQGRGDFDRVEAGEGASQAVGRLAAELEELDPERAARPIEERLGVEV